jgi:hypothetical protein
VKLGALEHDGRPNGYVVWTIETTAMSWMELRSLWGEFSKKDEHNALILSDLLRYPDQCNAIIGSHQEDQTLQEM